MKNTISQTRIRFKTNDINDEWVTDLASSEGDKLGYHLVFEDNTEYLIVFNSFPLTSFDNRIVTHVSHYERFNNTSKWNSIDDANIDLNYFPNKRSLLIDKSLYIGVNDGKYYDINDPAIYINSSEEILDEEGNSYDPKQYKKVIDIENYVCYYDYVRFGQLGRAMEDGMFDDMENRLASLVSV